jgi:hypothetical protein
VNFYMAEDPSSCKASDTKNKYCIPEDIELAID